MVYLLSAFDNSIYTFDGGRALNKFYRMNDVRNSSDVVEAITDGVFNVKDNTLLLQTASTFVWIRDGIVTQNDKKAAQTGITLFDTTDGIVICNNTKKWIYSYLALSSSTVQTLNWQSAYHGLLNNTLGEVTAWVITLHSPGGKISATVTLYSYSFDQEQYYTQSEPISLTPSDWNDLYFTRIRIQPTQQQALAHSVRINTTSKVVITDVSAEYTEDAQATIAASRSV